MSNREQNWIAWVSGAVVLALCAYIFFYNRPENRRKSDENLPDCKRFHSGVFVYYNQLNEGITKKISIKGDQHLEQSLVDSSFILSKIDRINNCIYKLSIIDLKIDSTHRAIGDEIVVNITKTYQDTMEYVARRGDRPFKGILVKLAEATPPLP